MTSPRGEGHYNDKLMQEELERRVDLGIDDTVDPVDMSELEVPAPGQHGSAGGDVRKQKAVRMGKRWSEVMTHVQNGDYTWEQFASALHPRELARGQLFDSRGGFSGRPPSLVPRAFHDACVRELLKRGSQMYKENYIQAINAMTSIATNPAAKEADRIKAAMFVIERLEGKVPERVIVEQAAPWEAILEGAIAEVSENEKIAYAQDYLNRMPSPDAS